MEGATLYSGITATQANQNTDPFFMSNDQNAVLIASNKLSCSNAYQPIVEGSQYKYHIVDLHNMEQALARKPALSAKAQ